MKKLNICTISTLLLCLFFFSQAFSQTRGWGANYYGQLGNGNQAGQPTPVTIAAVPDAVGIGSGYLHTLFLKADGTLAAAGYNGNRQIGDGTTTSPRTLPVSVLGLTNIIQAADGGEHSVALRADGTVWAWGRNSEGEIGSGITTTTVPTPAQSSISNVVQVDAGYYHTLALKADGTVWAWGYNAQGQLGDGTTTQRVTPVQVGASVAGFTNIIAVSAGEFHSIALKADGTLWVWGYNGYGQVGNGTTTPGNQLLPVQNLTLTNVVQISAGAHHSMALKKDGTLWIWGRNSEGEVGNGVSGSNQLVPVLNTNPNITNIVEIDAMNGYSSYVRRRDGTVWAWGGNWDGQIGNGTTTITGCKCNPTPVQSSVGAGNADIGGGYYHAFALKPVVPVSTGANKTLQGENLGMTFSNITGAGNVSYTSIDPSAVAASYTVPPGYTIQPNQPAYDVTTTATLSGTVDVCIKNVNEYNAANFALLKILHAEGSNWVDRTFSATFQKRQICARVSTLSPFVIASSLAPTAAGVSVSGRVISGKSGVSRATITVTGADGTTRTAKTNSFGYYRVEGLPAGETYVFNVQAKGFEFAPQVVSVNDNLADFDFTAIE